MLEKVGASVAQSPKGRSEKASQDLATQNSSLGPRGAVEGWQGFLVAPSRHSQAFGKDQVLPKAENRVKRTVFKQLRELLLKDLNALSL